MALGYGRIFFSDAFVWPRVTAPWFEKFSYFYQATLFSYPSAIIGTRPEKKRAQILQNKDLVHHMPREKMDQKLFRFPLSFFQIRYFVIKWVKYKNGLIDWQHHWFLFSIIALQGTYKNQNLKYFVWKLGSIRYALTRACTSYLSKGKFTAAF